MNTMEQLVKSSDPHHANALIELIKAHADKQDKILDLCCGYGRIATPLMLEGYDVIGVDISHELIRRTSNRYPSSFLAGNMRDLPFEDQSFDFVFCVWASFNFLLTTSDQLRVLEEMSRILRPGGRALIECPLHKYQQAVIRTKDGYRYYPLTMRELQQLGKDLLRRSWNWGCPEILAFRSWDVLKVILAGRDRMVGIFTK